MNKKLFKREILEIVDRGYVESQKLEFPKTIEKLINYKEALDYFYEDFMDNYYSLYGEDSSNFIMKIQDFVYRLDLLCSIIPPQNDIKDFFAILKNGNHDLYSAVSYDADETKEILEDFEMGYNL